MTAPDLRPRSVDLDPLETQEWIDALRGIVAAAGNARAGFILETVTRVAQEMGVTGLDARGTPYRNSIPTSMQGRYPGNLAVEERLVALMRWNALAMVIRANEAHGELGGHIASYASAAEIFEVGFNHFFRGSVDGQHGDLVYFQPHSAPGVYARAYLEGRLGEEELAHYRQEAGGRGLSSYPHPWLMPDFWQFPTGSMGLGPLNAVYQARFMRYLAARGFTDTHDRHVWGIFGDGEMDEPESLSGLSLAGREGLDNLTFIVNCNLQRLDGPVRGNGKIIQELESVFLGAGWRVIKVIWGSEWDELFARDSDRVLERALGEIVDGDYQTLGANDGAYNLKHFFQRSAAVAELASHLSQSEINGLKRGGHDFRKLHAAFHAARQRDGRPTVILAKTKKGFGMGGAGESRMTAHQTKKLDEAARREFRDRFALPLTDDDVRDLRFCRPPDDSPETSYLRARREALGGALPMRNANCATLEVPGFESWAQFALASNDKEMSTTLGAVRMLTGLLKDQDLGRRIVPIVADEARTFGMASLFRQIGIYSPQGQRYVPEDSASILSYRETQDGQLLEEGIHEAGALSSWVAAATSYSVHGIAMLPVYIFYSMFGFQRVGDLIWAAADQRARGFLFGATAGRTTLSGEGLQHQDGSSLLIASTVPNCRAWDPAFVSEVAVIMRDAMVRMLSEQRDEFHYLTLTNASYPMPSLQSGVERDLLAGMYRYSCVTAERSIGRVRLLGSGALLLEVLKAAQILATEYGVSSEVFSVTSFSELAREACELQRLDRIEPQNERRTNHINRLLPGTDPVVAVSDYVRAWPQLISEYIDAPYVTLGTDGFGRSDSRAELRRFFEVDAESVVLAALEVLGRSGAALRWSEDSSATIKARPFADEPPWKR